MKTREIDERLPNYIRVHRRSSGLTQRELCSVLGYRDEETIARHERFHLVPTLAVAIKYEIVFRVPVSEMFAGLRDEMEVKIEAGLVELEEQLGRLSAQDRNALATARKLMWLGGRKASSNEVVT